MTGHAPSVPIRVTGSPLAWGAGPRLAAVALVALGLWAAVGWALGWLP